MPLIKQTRAIGENWPRLPDDAAPPKNGPVLIPLSRWLAEREKFLGRASSVGILLNSDQGPEDWGDSIKADLELLSVVALDFPAFTDGRAYSTARLLRERHGYRGELRAVGDVLLDQIPLMLRCGFDAFEVGENVTLDRIEAAADRYSAWYQPTGDGRASVRELRAAQRRRAS